MLSEYRYKIRRRLLGVSLLMSGSMMLFGCASSAIKEPVSGGVELQASDDIKAAIELESPTRPRTQLYVYQDDGAVAQIVKHHSPRKGYFIEFSLIKESESNVDPKPKTVVYRD